MAVWELLNWIRGGRDLEQLAARIAEAADLTVWGSVADRLPTMSRGEARGYVFAHSGPAIQREARTILARQLGIQPQTVEQVVLLARWQVVDRVMARLVYGQTSGQHGSRNRAA